MFLFTVIQWHGDPQTPFTGISCGVRFHFNRIARRHVTTSARLCRRPPEQNSPWCYTGVLWGVPRKIVLNASSGPSQQHETMPPPHPFQSAQLMGNWSRLERSPVQRYQGWEGGVNSGRDASEVKPLIMITNWSWLLERQAAAVGRPAFEVPPACCRVPGPLAWGDAGTMWLPVGKNVMRRQGDGAQDGWRVDGSVGPAGGACGSNARGPLGMAQWDERGREQGCVHVLLWSEPVFFGYTHSGWGVPWS